MIGIIGGSGLYQIEGLRAAQWRQVSTPFGAPSDELFVGELDQVPVAFLPRHGRGHRIPPSDINYRANIAAMKSLGVTDIVSLSAVGSFREELAPGTFVIVDQFVDRTFARVKTFFGTGLVAHVSMAHPVCHRLGDTIEQAARSVGVDVVRGGSYLVMEGPQFSTEAESRLYRQWGLSVIGMTNMPEAKLAREAEICYATVAMVTDFDCWHPGHASVTVQQVIKVLNDNADRARSLVRAVVPQLGQRPVPCGSGCDRVLDTAIITAPTARDPEMVARLQPIAGRVL